MLTEPLASLESLADELFDFDTAMGVAQDFPDDELALSVLMNSYQRVVASGDMARLASATEQLIAASMMHICMGEEFQEKAIIGSESRFSIHSAQDGHFHDSDHEHNHEDDEDDYEWVDGKKLKKKRK